VYVAHPQQSAGKGSTRVTLEKIGKVVPRGARHPFAARRQLR